MLPRVLDPPPPDHSRTKRSIFKHNSRPPIWCHSSTGGTSVTARCIYGPTEPFPVTGLRRPTVLWAFGPTHSILGRRNGTSAHCIVTPPSIPQGVFDVLYRHGSMWYRFPCTHVVLIFGLCASPLPPSLTTRDHLLNFQPRPSTSKTIPFKHHGY